MKKLAILASVVMIFTAPIMALSQATPSPDEIRLEGRVEGRVEGTDKEYGFSFDGEDSKKPGQKGVLRPSLQTAPADTVGVGVPGASLSRSEDSLKSSEGDWEGMLRNQNNRP
jgi:hypothetical protein